MPAGVEAVDPEEETPSGHEFLCQLLEKKHKAEEKVLIISTLDHISEAQAHMSTATTNLLSLAKITDSETFRLVLKAMVHPMVQLNIPPQYLDPVRDPKPMSAVDQQVKKIEARLLPHRDLNSGTVKEACETFLVMAKMLSKILLGKRYLSGSDKGKGPKERPKKRKSQRSDMAAKKPDNDDDDDQPSAPKEARSTMKGRPN